MVPSLIPFCDYLVFFFWLISLTSLSMFNIISIFRLTPLKKYDVPSPFFAFGHLPLYLGRRSYSFPVLLSIFIMTFEPFLFPFFSHSIYSKSSLAFFFYFWSPYKLLHSCMDLTFYAGFLLFVNWRLSPSPPFQSGSSPHLSCVFPPVIDFLHLAYLPVFDF